MENDDDTPQAGDNALNDTFMRLVAQVAQQYGGQPPAGTMAGNPPGTPGIAPPPGPQGLPLFAAMGGGMPSTSSPLQQPAPQPLPLGTPNAAMGTPMTLMQQGQMRDVAGYGQVQGGYDPQSKSVNMRGLEGPQIPTPDSVLSPPPVPKMPTVEQVRQYRKKYFPNENPR